MEREKQGKEKEEPFELLNENPVWDPAVGQRTQCGKAEKMAQNTELLKAGIICVSNEDSVK